MLTRSGADEAILGALRSTPKVVDGVALDSHPKSELTVGAPRVQTVLGVAVVRVLGIKPDVVLLMLRQTIPHKIRLSGRSVDGRELLRLRLDRLRGLSELLLQVALPAAASPVLTRSGADEAIMGALGTTAKAIDRVALDSHPLAVLSLLTTRAQTSRKRK